MLCPNPPMNPRVHRGGCRSARQSCGVRSGASNVRDLPRQHRRYATPCGRARTAARSRSPLLLGTRGRDRRIAVAPTGGESGTEDAAARLLSDHAPTGAAQVQLRHVAARVRYAAGAPARRLRHLPDATRPHALCRSLPCHRTGARVALQRMQSRHRSVQGQSRPAAGGDRLYRRRARRVGRRPAHAPAPLGATTRRARRGVAANWRSAACCA
jgi:hypothetical protein